MSLHDGRKRPTQAMLVTCLATTVLLTVSVGYCGKRPASVRAPARKRVKPARPTEHVSPAPEANANAVIWRTPQPPMNLQAGDIWVNPKDGMEMVYVPPGEFTLGTSDQQAEKWLKEYPTFRSYWFSPEQPQCRVRLPGYWIGRTEVTNAQYHRYLEATAREKQYWKLLGWRLGEGEVPPDMRQLPVVGVAVEGAREYSVWAGGRLPSELEWEKAARGTDGRTFPWGDQWDPNRCQHLGVVDGEGQAAVPEFPTELTPELGRWERSHVGWRDGPAKVGSYPAGASPYGCLDMAGNAWEYCSELYEEDAYRRYARGDFSRPYLGKRFLLRGGAWYFAHPYAFRCAWRSGSDQEWVQVDGIGFRYVVDGTPVRVGAAE